MRSRQRNASADRPGQHAQAVEQADVVVTNPVHVAVFALRPDKMSALVIVARGGEIAERIKRVARSIGAVWSMWDRKCCPSCIRPWRLGLVYRFQVATSVEARKGKNNGRTKLAAAGIEHADLLTVFAVVLILVMFVFSSSALLDVVLALNITASFWFC